MMTFYYAPGACSMAAHIVLEESGEKYQPQKVDLAGGEQRTEAYLKINPLGRVPALRLDSGEPLAENTAILPYLGKRFGLWPSDPMAEAKALSLIGFFAASVHPAHAHVGRPERYAADPSAFPTLKETGRKAFHGYLAGRRARRRDRPKRRILSCPGKSASKTRLNALMPRHPSQRRAFIEADGLPDQVRQ